MAERNDTKGTPTVDPKDRTGGSTPMQGERVNDGQKGDLSGMKPRADQASERPDASRPSPGRAEEEDDVTTEEQDEQADVEPRDPDGTSSKGERGVESGLIADEDDEDVDATRTTGGADASGKQGASNAKNAGTSAKNAH